MNGTARTTATATTTMERTRIIHHHRSSSNNNKSYASNWSILACAKSANTASARALGSMPPRNELDCTSIKPIAPSTSFPPRAGIVATPLRFAPTRPIEALPTDPESANKCAIGMPRRFRVSCETRLEKGLWNKRNSNRIQQLRPLRRWNGPNCNDTTARRNGSACNNWNNSTGPPTNTMPIAMPNSGTSLVRIVTNGNGPNDEPGPWGGGAT